MNKYLAILLVPVFSALVVGCPNDKDASSGSSDGGHSDEGEQAASNRIDIPQSVRDNLGITFVKVEKRDVEQTLRFAGTFESPPSARREYRTALAGRVEVLPRQYDLISPGDVLFRIDSPEWREVIEKLGGQEADIEITKAMVEVAVAEIVKAEAALDAARKKLKGVSSLRNAHDQHVAVLEESVLNWTARLGELEKLRVSGGGRAAELAQAKAELSQVKIAIAEANEESAQLTFQLIELESDVEVLGASIASLRAQEGAAQTSKSVAQEKFNLALASAASLVGMKIDEFTTPTRVSGKEVPTWKQLSMIEVVAVAPGKIDELLHSSGAWVEEGEQVLSTVDFGATRFRAAAYQANLGEVSQGQVARIVPPQGGSLELQNVMHGTVAFGTEADADERTIDLIVAPDALLPWARPGVASYLEVVVHGEGEAELAIPVSSVIKDGLERVYFRRDPANPDKVIRIEADLGTSDGRWVVLKSGVAEGDEVVLDGVYELMLTGSGKASKGGHFHADGTFHEGEH